MKASPQERQEMLDLISEMRVILLRVPNIKSDEEKKRTQDLLEEIKEKMQDFRRRYPDD